MIPEKTAFENQKGEGFFKTFVFSALSPIAAVSVFFIYNPLD
jgi:hypothetical protein